jgi:hypothetical protein
MRGDQPLGPADNPDVRYKVVPTDKNGKPILPASGGADWSYRIRCESIPAKSEFDFVAALEVVNDPPPTVLGASLFGPPQEARWITITARFQTSGRNRTKIISQCPVGLKPCITDKPESILGRWFSLLRSKLLILNIWSLN